MRQFLTLVCLSAFLLLVQTTAFAYTLQAFRAEDYYSPTGVPTLGEVSALNTAAGISGFAFEDFEDTSLLPGLTVNEPIALQTHDGTNLFRGAWDGDKSFEHLLNPTGADLTFNYASGAGAIGIGISGIGVDESILVNGSDELDVLRELPQFAPENGLNRRSVYVLVCQEPNDDPITDLAITRPSGISGDWIYVDHIGIGAQCVPEPTGAALAFGCGVALLAMRGRR